MYRKVISAALLATVLLSLPACKLLPAEEEVLAPPVVEPPKVEYTTAAVARKSIQKEIRGSGTFVPVREHSLSFRNLSGKLDQLYVMVNDEVKEGQLLAELDSGDTRYKIELKVLEIEKLKLKLKQLEEDDANLERAVQLAQMDFEYAELWYKVEQTKTRENDLKRSQIKLEQAQQQLYENSGNKEVARVDIKTAELQLADLQNNLEKCKLVSPIDGKVTYVEKLAAGDNIAMYRNIIVVSDPSVLQLSYTNNDLSAFRVGMEIEVKIRNTTYNAVVSYIPSAAPLNTDPKLKNTVTFAVKNLPKDVRIGETAGFVIVTEKKDNVLVVPKNALRTFGARNFVEVLDKESKRERDIEKGIDTATEVEIVKGLKEGEVVIIK